MSSSVNEKAIARTGEPVRAVVCATGEETPYLRAGRGDAVLLLLADYDGPLAIEMIEELSRRFLVVAPKVPRVEAEEAFGRWLTNLIEGLGMIRPSIMAQTRLMTQLARFSAEENARVTGIWILPSSRLPNAVPVTPPAGECTADEA